MVLITKLAVAAAVVALLAALVDWRTALAAAAAADPFWLAGALAGSVMGGVISAEK